MTGGFKRAILCMLLLLLCCAALQAQHLPLVHYTAGQGLPSNTVYSLYRDTKGFLWLSTDKGLARYNGISFQTFTTFDGLPDNEIFFVVEDKSGRLWLATYNGELCYYQDGVFYSAANTPWLALPFKTSFIDDIKVEADSSITFVFKNEDRILNIEGETARVYDVKGSGLRGELLKLLIREKLPNRGYRIYTINEVIDLDSAMNVVKREKRPYEFFMGQKSEIWGRAVVQGHRYIYNEHRVFNDKMEQVMSFKPGFREDMRQVYFDGTNYLIVTYKGIYVKDSVNVFEAEKLSCITRDTRGDYWISSLVHGVYKLSGNFTSIKNIANKAGAVKYVAADHGNIFFTGSGNNVWRLGRDTASIILAEDQYVQKRNFYKFGSYLVNNDTLIYSDNFQTMVVSGISGRLSLKRYNSGNFPFLTFDKSIRAGNDIYINAKNCIIRFSLAGNQPFTYGVQAEASSRIFDIGKDAGGHIWYSTVNGLYEITSADTAIKPVFYDLPLKAFGFYGKYLVGYTHHNQLIVATRRANGFACDTVSSQNCIWGKFCEVGPYQLLISTNKLYRVLTLGKENGSYTIWPVENEFLPLNADAVAADARDCYFFTSGLIVRHKISSLCAKPAPPALFFTNLAAGDSVYRIGKEVSLDYGNAKSVNVLFTALSQVPDIFYEYSISGNGRDKWTAITGNEINLANTRYGDYVIKVRAKTLSSGYGAPAAFTLHIRPPFWGRTWFILLALGAVTALILVAVRLFTRRALRRKSEKMEQHIAYLKMEYKALNALMNPHFIFNTLNNVQSLYNQNKKLAANEYLRVFADLIRQNMENIAQEQISLEEELDLVANYLLLEKLRFDDRLDFSFSVDDDLDISSLMVAPLMVQPLVENSIKHGILPSDRASGTIRINVHSKDGMCRIEVWDNGIGFEAAAKMASAHHHTSLGLISIERRIKQLSIIQSRDIEFQIYEQPADDGTIWTVAVISIPL